MNIKTEVFSPHPDSIEAMPIYSETHVLDGIRLHLSPDLPADLMGYDLRLRVDNSHNRELIKFAVYADDGGVRFKSGVAAGGATLAPVRFGDTIVLALPGLKI